MRKVIFSFILLLMAIAVQAQRTQCIHRVIPYPEKAQSQVRAARRAHVGNKNNYEGSKRGLIILMEFQDTKFVNKDKRGKDIDVHEFWNNIANKEGLKTVNGIIVNGSIRDYFVSQSYGKFAIDFDVCGPYTAKNKYAYYGRNKDWGSTTFDQAPFELIIEAVNAANGEVNYKDYDWDDDGEVDQVYVLYAGHGEASYDDPETIWPHESELEGWTGEKTILQGLAINTYACGNEIDNADRTMGIGTICHEFSHCLGLPDVYDAATGESVVGYYDIMDSGNYNGDSWYPAAYSAFERYFCGWIEPKPVNGLNEVGEMEPITSSPDAYIIRPFEGSTNYWMIEKRQKASWDKFLPCFTNNTTGEAITEKQLCWYIDYDQAKWEIDRPNEDRDHLGISIVDPEQVPSAIMALEKTSNHPVAWYDLQGHRLQGAPTQRGTYIVRDDDGTTKKCIQ